MKRLRLVLVLAGMSWAGAAPLAGQDILGTLHDSESRQPIEGAMVYLVNAEDRLVAQRLTNAVGRFILETPGPGVYRVRADRIGHASTWSETLPVKAGERVHITLEAEVAPVSLETIRVVADQQCRVRPADGSVHEVWEEARKALAIAAWTDEQQTHRYRIRHWSQPLDREARGMRAERSRLESTWQRQTFESLPVETLIDAGYAQHDRDDIVFYGPDAAVLLSNEFLDTHCFALRRGRGESAGLLGLVFEPVTRPHQVDVAGTLWMDPVTAQLRWLDFRYQALETLYPDVDEIPAQDLSGGRVEFRPLPSGPWIVSRWYLRMPQLGLRPGTGWRVAEVLGFFEEGAEVLRVVDFSDATLLATGSAVVSGTVRTELGEPVSGAYVSLLGTTLTSVSDSVGAFRISGVADGVHAMVIEHPAYDSLGYSAEPREVAVRSGDAMRVRVVLPSRAAIMARRCADVETLELPQGWRPAHVVGRVLSADGSTAIDGANVRLEWDEFRTRPAGHLGKKHSELTTTTAAGGRFLLCGAPSNHPLTLVATVGEVVHSVPLRIPGNRSAWIEDLRLPAQPSGGAGLPSL